MGIPTDFASRITDVVNDMALLFANESDERFVAALKQLRRDLNTEYGDRFPGVPETAPLVERVLEFATIQRHDIQINSGTPSRALH